MKKQEKLFIALFSIGLVLFQSCDDRLSKDTGSDEIIESKKEVAIGISQEIEKIQYSEPIYSNENTEFIEGEEIQKLPQSMKMKKVRSSESNDTITNAEEIPVMTALSISQNIYTDGSISYISQDITTEDMLFIEKINVNPQPQNEKITKKVIKDNIVSLYNSNGELLKSEQMEDLNLKPMLDSLQMYLTDTKQNSPAKVKSMRAKAIFRAQANGMRLVSESDSEVVMEIDMTSANISKVQKAKSTVSRKAVMRFSPDMKRMYSSRVYENKQLTELVEMEYASDNDSQFANSSMYISNSILPDANIKAVKRKTLMFKPDGTPYIMNNKENYKKNQITYNLKK